MEDFDQSFSIQFQQFRRLGRLPQLFIISAVSCGYHESCCPITTALVFVNIPKHCSGCY